MSNRFRAPWRNIPAPQGSKAGSSYARFIPREELGEVDPWTPDTLDGGEGSSPVAPGGSPAANGAAAAPPAPAEPDAEQWQARVAAARQAGYQDGYRDGLTALESFKQSFAAQSTAQVGALVQAFDQQFQALDQRIADTLTRCAVELARQVLLQELRTHPDQVARLAADAVQELMLAARHVTVRVHPQDLPLVAQGADEVLAARGARLQADPTLDRGGVLVESDLGSIDARMSTRWGQAAAAFGSSAPWHAPDPAPAPAAKGGPHGVDDRDGPPRSALP
jgi:flagellar assembly protein FliH